MGTVNQDGLQLCIQKETRFHETGCLNRIRSIKKAGPVDRHKEQILEKRSADARAAFSYGETGTDTVCRTFSTLLTLETDLLPFAVFIACKDEEGTGQLVSRERNPCAVDAKA